MKFPVVHLGFTFPVVAYVDERAGDVRAFEMGRDVPRSQPRLVQRFFRDETSEIDRTRDYTRAYDELRSRLETLTDLIHAGLTWNALLSCQQGSGLFGVIISAAAQHIRLPHPPLTGGPQARAWSRESSK
jgi:hypothetical protein